MKGKAPMVRKRRKHWETPIILVKHFLGETGSLWSAKELTLYYGQECGKSAIYRSLHKLEELQVIIKIGLGFTLNPMIVSGIRANTNQIKRLKDRADEYKRRDENRDGLSQADLG